MYSDERRKELSIYRCMSLYDFKMFALLVASDCACKTLLQIQISPSEFKKKFKKTLPLQHSVITPAEGTREMY